MEKDAGKEQKSFLILAPPKEFDTILTDEKQIQRAADVLRHNTAVDDTLGWKAVRQIAVDNDWSALRFRPREAVGK